MKELMPLTEIKIENLFDKDGILKAKYLIGSPRGYRFNASTGVLNFLGTQVLTQPNQPFSFTPIAYRFFEDSLFGKEEKSWIEFFFLNESLQMCSLMFHGYSAQEFKKHYADYLFYDDLTPCECAFTVTPIQHKNEREKSTYYIASFSSKKATPETIEAVRVLVETSQPIYRDETLKSSGKHLISQNFKLSESDAAKTMRMIDEEKKELELLREFDNVGMTVSSKKIARAA